MLILAECFVLGSENFLQVSYAEVQFSVFRFTSWSVTKITVDTTMHGFRAFFSALNLIRMLDSSTASIRTQLVAVIVANISFQDLSLSEAEARFQIHEFVLWLAPVKGTVITKTHLEELEYICGKGMGYDNDDEISPWVSEACIKLIVLALLGLLANDKAHIQKVHNAAPLPDWTFLTSFYPPTRHSNQPSKKYAPTLQYLATFSHFFS